MYLDLSQFLGSQLRVLLLLLLLYLPLHTYLLLYLHKYNHYLGLLLLQLALSLLEMQIDPSKHPLVPVPIPLMNRHHLLYILLPRIQMVLVLRQTRSTFSALMPQSTLLVAQRWLRRKLLYFVILLHQPPLVDGTLQFLDHLPSALVKVIKLLLKFEGVGLLSLVDH